MKHLKLRLPFARRGGKIFAAFAHAPIPMPAYARSAMHPEEP